MFSSGYLVCIGCFSLASHLWFKHLEPTDLHSVIALLGVVPGVAAVLACVLFGTTLSTIPTTYSCYYAILLLSITLYRLSPLHPLYRFPGPLLCKISKFWIVYKTSQGSLHRYFKDVHDKHGPVVRIGPNELSIVDVTLLPRILGVNGMPKGPLWDGRRIKRGSDAEQVKSNLIGARSSKQHAEARKVWNRAFTSASVRRYEPIVIRRATQLVEELQNRCIELSNGKRSTTVDMAEWLSFFSWDFMGDFVFGGAFELMRDGDKGGLLKMMDEGLFLPALTQHIPWCISALSYTPFLGKNMKKLGEFAYKQATRRAEQGPVHDDLFYHLNDEGRVDSEPPSMAAVIWSTIVAIIAGSDTSASALSNAIYFLISNPSYLERLRAEVDAAFPPGSTEPSDSAKLAQLELLGAIINESMRLYPPVATSLQRAPAAGSGGHLISPNIYIPEGTAVYVSPYAYHRDRRYFHPDPDSFWPERWLEGQHHDIVHNADAFLPFSNGPTNCVGRPLALIEMRMVLAYLVQAFDMTFADDSEPRQWERGLKDFFVTQRGPLPIVLCRRSLSV